METRFMSNRSVQQAARPVKCKIWPVQGLQALQEGHGGAWRVWALAYALDPEGSGAVRADALADFAGDLGVHPRTFRRWLAEALDLGVLDPVKWDGGDWYRLRSVAKASRALGVSQVGPRPAVIAPALLVESGWRAHLWAAFVASLRGRPFSRARMRAWTGVPERTQRRYEREAGVEACANYEVTDRPASAQQVEGERELGRVALVWQDKGTRGPVMARRLPDSRSAPDSAAPGRGGRTRKIARELNGSDLSKGRRGPSVKARLFYERGIRQAEQAARRLTRPDDKRARPPHGVRELFGKRRGTARAATWKAVSLVPAGL